MTKISASAAKVKLSLCRAQTMAEYAIVMSLVLAAVLGMQVYIKRGLQARYRDASRMLISQMRQATGDSSIPLQYEPYYTNSEFTVEQNSYMDENIYGPGAGVVGRYSNAIVNQIGNQVVLPGCAADDSCPQ